MTSQSLSSMVPTPQRPCHTLRPACTDHQERESHRQSSSLNPMEDEPGSPFPGGEENQTSGMLKGDRQSESEQQRSEKSMNNSPKLGSIVEEKPYTTPTTVPEQRYSPLREMSTVFEEVVPPCPQSPRCKLPTPPQPTTPITISWALYLLATGKLVRIPNILSHVPLIDLFNHFLEELVADQDWARTPAGIDYTHYGYSYILKEEARDFACQAYNMIHQDCPIQVPARYQRPQIDLPPITYTPEPMADEPPVPPR